MSSSASTVWKYARCACGASVRVEVDPGTGDGSAPCGGCGADVRAPRRKRKAPDVVLPRI